MTFAPARLRVARRLKDLTLQQLGERVAAPASILSRFERGEREPTQELREALAAALEVTPEFFTQPVFDEFKEDQCSFRRRKGASERLKKRILAQGTIFGDVVRYLMREVSLPTFDVPSIRVSSDEDVEHAAMRCREYWGLGTDAPITSMVRVLERAGVIVTQLDSGAREIDAFARHGGVTIVVLNTAKGSSSRMRFDMAHELGHIVMHRLTKPDLAVHEPQADRFASAFLLPEDGFGPDFAGLRRVEWPHLLELKRHWGASLAAIIRRAYDLQLIDAAHYRRLYKALSAKKWRTGEPQEPVPEEPEVVPLAFAWLRENRGTTPWDVAHDLRVQPMTLAEITGLEVTPPRPEGRDVLSLDRFRKHRSRPA